LELTEMSVLLMDNVMCNELPVLFLLFYGFIFSQIKLFVYMHITTSIIWKHRDNAGTVVKVIEWDLEDGSTDIPNAKFKSHATLDKNTGNLNLKYLQLKHSGTYTVEINSKEQRKQFTLTVMEPVCKPHIVKKCVLEDVSGCLLICVGEASSESTVIWKYWDGEKLHEQYPNMRTITVTNSGNPDSHYTCTLKNAVSVETSDPVYLKYLFHGKTAYLGYFINENRGEALTISLCVCTAQSLSLSLCVCLCVSDVRVGLCASIKAAH
uniref:Ig-like domain-containing protein n=1 Tax=Sinocyclocheilus rhinocerous TaxID=307959 RepID=A0A673JRD3_9TELE